MLATSQIYDMAAQQPQKSPTLHFRQAQQNHGAAILSPIWDPFSARRGIALVDLSSKAKVR